MANPTARAAPPGGRCPRCDGLLEAKEESSPSLGAIGGLILTAAGALRVDQLDDLHQEAYRVWAEPLAKIYTAVTSPSNLPA